MLASMMASRVSRRPPPTAVLLGLLYLMAWLAPCLTAFSLGLITGVALSQRFPALPCVWNVVTAVRQAAQHLLTSRTSQFL